MINSHFWVYYCSFFSTEEENLNYEISQWILIPKIEIFFFDIFFVVENNFIKLFIKVNNAKNLNQIDIFIAYISNLLKTRFRE